MNTEYLKMKHKYDNESFDKFFKGSKLKNVMYNRIYQNELKILMMKHALNIDYYKKMKGVPNKHLDK